MDKKTFNVALVGCGTVSLNHLYALSLLDKVNVVALCDIDEAKAENAAKEFSLNCRIYKDYVTMLDNESLDAVHVSTPHYLHAKMAIEALNRGINVFLEKPMCISTSEIDELFKAEKESSASVCVCFQNRFIKATEHAKRIIEEDGDALAANFSLFWRRDEKYYTESGWRGSYSTEGGGVMINQAIHSLDLLTVLLGKPVQVCATTSNHHLKGIIEVEDTCEGIIEFENGKQANFYATTSASIGDYTSICITTKNHVIRIELPNIIVDGVFTSYEDKKNTVGKACYGSGHVDLIKMFYEALSTNGKMPVTLEEAQFAVRILLAAYKSNNEKTII